MYKIRALKTQLHLKAKRNLCSHFFYLLSNFLKFGIRDLDILFFFTHCKFREIQLTQGSTFLMALSEITFTCDL